MGEVKHNSMPVYSVNILKGIPVGKHGRKYSFPFEEMEVDECFFSVEKNPGASASAYGLKTWKKFTTVSNYEYEGQTGWMCWRIK